jgi:hypothetical protein
MQVPGVVPRGGSGPCRYLARWVGGRFGPLQVPGPVGRGPVRALAVTWHGGWRGGWRGRLSRLRVSCRIIYAPRAPGCAGWAPGLLAGRRVVPRSCRGSGGRGISSGGGMSPVGWGGGQLAVGLADQPPAALMDRSVVGSAYQGQVGQVGRAAMEPMAQMMGLTPGQRPRTAGEHTTTVTHSQGGPLGGLDDPAGPPDLQRLGGGATKDRGEQGHRGPQPGRQPVHPAQVVGLWWGVAARVVGM